MGGRDGDIGEFDIIARYFAPLTGGDPLTFGLTDDAALIEIPQNRQLVITKDLMVAGVHFMPDDPADLIGRKLLRVNLSDLAAMGAMPAAYLLGIALPGPIDEAGTVDEEWLAAFAGGLSEDQERYGIHLVGGDTVATPGPLTLSLTALGTVEPGRALSRSGAKVGDDIYVSGTLGDAALGLKMLQGALEPLLPELVDRYRLPRPRLGLGQALRGLATAVADISDGLVADLGHICDASGVGGEIYEANLPISPGTRAVLDGAPERMTSVLAGGDDYELVFTAPAAVSDELRSHAEDLSLSIVQIGQIEATRGVRIITPDGGKRSLQDQGFTHF